jgi:hypothetical protein
MTWMRLAALTIILTIYGGGYTATRAAAVQQGSPATCQNIQLLIRPHGSNGAAGHIGLIYRIHNLSGRSCSLYGYPGVQLLDRHFVTMPTTVTRGGSFLGSIPKQRVTLPAGGNAYFTLVYSDVPTGSGPCPTARNLMIFAPNNFLPVVTYAAPRGGGITACNGALSVSPVTAQPRFQ